MSTSKPLPSFVFLLAYGFALYAVILVTFALALGLFRILEAIWEVLL